MRERGRIDYHVALAALRFISSLIDRKTTESSRVPRVAAIAAALMNAMSAVS